MLNTHLHDFSRRIRLCILEIIKIIMGLVKDVCEFVMIFGLVTHTLRLPKRWTPRHTQKKWKNELFFFAQYCGICFRWGKYCFSTRVSNMDLQNLLYKQFLTMILNLQMTIVIKNHIFSNFKIFGKMWFWHHDLHPCSNFLRWIF